MRPSDAARPEYVEAFTEIVQRIIVSLRDLPDSEPEVTGPT
jgi:hypothetical protein